MTAINRSEITDDTPLRLSVAAALAYPDGSMSASGLRTAATKGLLEIERVAGKLYTTLAAIRKMRERCRVPAVDRTSGCDQPDQTTPPDGSSKTVDTSKALAAARATVNALKQSSPTTSPASTSGRRRKPANVIPLPSRSPTS